MAASSGLAGLVKNFEFYETPAPFTRWLFREVASVYRPITGRIFECCVGDGAIIKAAQALPAAVDRQWGTNDLDPRWSADYHFDAAGYANRSWEIDIIGGVDWTVSNPPFTPAIEIIENAIGLSRVGVAMHLRASIHEVLKTGVRRTWMATHTPTGILWLPRFAYQRSPTTGKWTTDSVCACWCVWLKDPAIPQFIRYAPEQVIDELDAETPAYRARMDRIMAERAA
jgi:hypothetical protein